MGGVNRVRKIISGGQTGVDRGALEAAIALGILHGGYCPRGRRAEDGVIPDRYRLGAAGMALRLWLHREAIRTLNVAGPRETRGPGIGEDARRFLVAALRPEREGDR